MADNGANDVMAEVKVEEPQVKAEGELNGAQPEYAVKKEESVDGEQGPAVEEESVGVKQEHAIKQEGVEVKQEQAVKQEDVKPEEDVKQEEGVKQEEDVKQEGVKQEVAVDVKKEAEIKDEGAVDVKKDDDSTDKKHTARKWKNYNKFDPTVLPESDDPEEIRKQVEFYFSESNLATDRFLFGLVGGKENKSVPLNLIASFKRMKRFPNKQSIIDALKESTELELGGEPGEETVKRKVAPEITELIPQNRQYGLKGGEWRSGINFDPIQDKAITRSIYAKGFGSETATTQIEIEKFFEPYGPINAVRLRRTMAKSFKGSVFVEFANDELAQKFLELEKKPTWGDKELLWMSKLAYVEGKIQDIKDGKIQAKPRSEKPQRGGNHNGSQNRHNGNRNNNDRNGRGGSRSGRGGQRGRGGGRGRGGHNDRRGGGDRENKRGDREGIKKEDNGIPKIKNSAEVKSESVDAPGPAKRKATDDGAQEVKKPKVEETAT